MPLCEPFASPLVMLVLMQGRQGVPAGGGKPGKTAPEAQTLATPSLASSPQRRP